MGEMRGVRSGKADKGAEGRDLPPLPPPEAAAAPEPAAPEPESGQVDDAGPVTSGRARQVWCAYADGGTGLVLFGREIEGLRYAATHALRCKAVAFGTPVMDQIGPE